jgi:pimeloyl-ACP methyl ester carboxylesterase
MYKPMLGLLSHDFDFFLHDIQGHGDSDHGGSFVGWNRSAELAFLAWQSHQHHYSDCPVFGVGHSFGGVLTAIISRQQPSCFTKVLLLDPVLFPPMYLFSMQCLTAAGLYHKNPMARKALRRRQHWPDLASAQQYFYNRGLFERWHHSALGAYLNHALTSSTPLSNNECDNAANAEHTGVMLKCKPAREAEIFASYPAGLWRILEQATLKQQKSTSSPPRLSSILPPTAVLYGKDTYGFIGRAVKRWQKFDATVEAQQVDGGHCFMQQYPAHTALWVRQFWQHIHLSTLPRR